MGKKNYGSEKDNVVKIFNYKISRVRRCFNDYLKHLTVKLENKEIDPGLATILKDCADNFRVKILDILKEDINKDQLNRLLIEEASRNIEDLRDIF